MHETPLHETPLHKTPSHEHSLHEQYVIDNFAKHFLDRNFEFDSRLCKKNSIFIALETGGRSGIEFIRNAVENGASVIISQSPVNIEGVQNIVVKNSLLFMQELAKMKFQILKSLGVQTIGITGSVGKTTTKELIANTLALHGTVCATKGNYNNHIGVPFTVLNCPINVRFLVLEMGMSNKHEIARLIEIAPCNFRLITNVGTAHSGNFENGEDGVLEAKFEMFEKNNAKCFVLQNLYSRFLLNKRIAQSCANLNIITVEPKYKTHYSENDTSFSIDGQTFELEGIYSASQLNMFCLAIALIEDILQKRVVEICLPQLYGRGKLVLWRGIKIINESYNASPDSMRNALTNFMHYSGRKLCILGEMLELGTNAPQTHKELEGEISKFNSVYLVGNNFNTTLPSSKVLHLFKSYNELLEFIQKEIENICIEYDVILVKASNGTMLWRLFNEVFI